MRHRAGPSRGDRRASGPDDPPGSDGAARGEPLRRLDVRTLLGDRREVVIVHNDSEYRLRITSNGKLILNK